MIYVVRTPPAPGVRCVMQRRSRVEPGATDYFCVSDDENIAPLHDGWYPDDTGGGAAVWGNGRYWEIRSTPFEVTESG